MAGETIVFFSKYTSLAGGFTYESDFYDVTGWKQINAEVLLAGSSGTGTATAQLFDSSDAQVWTAIGTASNLSSTVAPISKSYPARFIKLVIVVPSSMTIATLWAKAVARDA